MGSSLLEKRKILRALRLSETSMDIDEMIHLASTKLYPIIEMLVDSSNKGDHFLTSYEFDDAIKASKIIQDIIRVLSYANFKVSTRNIDFTLEKYKVSRNDQGKIYVETGLLLQIIDLYNILEDIKDIIDEFYRSIGIHSFVQTESEFSISSQESVNPNKIVLRLTRPLTKSSSSFKLLHKNFIVMPSTTDVSNDDDYNAGETLPIRESKSQISTSGAKSSKVLSTRKIKSTGSITEDEISGVTDIYGARRVVVRCICDLQEVSKYLSTERKDVSTICSRVEVDNLPTSLGQKSEISANQGGSAKRQKSSKISPIQETEGGTACCCPECFAEIGSKTDLQECDDDKVIICIKGCNEDEGDVQIVIRQCPDCKKAEEPFQKLPDKSVRPEKSVSPEKNPLSDTSTLPLTKSKSTIKEKSIQNVKSIKSIKSVGEDRPPVDEREILPVDVESISLHNKDSEGSVVCSEESDEEKIKKEMLPDSKSKTSSIKQTDPSFAKISNVQAQSSSIKPPTVQQQARVECSKIRFFETTNLCLETDTGQELIISVTVTPKNFDNKKISLRDIFSEDDNTNKLDPPVSDNRIDYQRRQSSDSTSHKSVSLRVPPEPPSYYVEDRVIPLERTKICSSVDFDVTTLESRIRDKGFQHKNAKIVVQLRDLGIDNLLRACRPAKCCRKAVLNEKMKKCLPYPPSLRSLPLDEDDMRVINESLQMSLQKVKNSTNINKDVYSNYSYSAKPIKTIMYFVVEEPKTNLESFRKNYIRQKLSYYINLVNDIEYKPISNYDILYFGVEEKSNKTLSNDAKKGSNTSNQNINSQHLANAQNVQTTPNYLKSGKGKFNKYEDRPMLTGFTNVDQKNSCSGNNFPKLVKNQSVVKGLQPYVNIQDDKNDSSQIKNHKMKMVSRIPRYKRNIRPTCLNVENDHNIEQIEQEVYGISLDSLPSENGLLKENNLSGGLRSKTSFSSKEHSNEENSIHKNVIQIKEQNCFPKRTDISRYSILSNYTARKSKRKKKAYYLSRSKSDISVKTIKHKCKNMATSTQSKDFSKKVVNKNQESLNNKKHLSFTSNKFPGQEVSSSLILNYFSKMLCEMIVRKSLRDTKLKNTVENKYTQENYPEIAENKSLYELYKSFSNKNNRRIDNLKIKNFHKDSNFYDLKAKKSQSCIVIRSRTNKKNICIINNLAIQTSALFGVTKQCQTSNSLLAYFSKHSIRPDDTYVQKKRVFKKIYNSEALSGIPNSCDRLENFIVVFKSEHSLKSNFSAEADFLSLSSEHSERSFDSLAKQTVSNSLFKLKETLEKYETLKKEITHGSLQEVNINPIEYFVYQMCACNKFNKKPSVMNKLLNKTRGIFSSAEHDIPNKKRNKKDMVKRSSIGKQQLCYQCGCLISKCEDTAISLKKTSNSSLPCQCPPENKQQTLPKQQCCKCKGSNIKTPSNLSKFTSASLSSVRSLKTYFKKSLSNIRNLSRSKEKVLGPCSCDKETTTTKNVETVCIPENIKVVPCPKKDTSTVTSTDFSTGITKESSTQKCDCTKCEAFAEDGSCCCSHCLGCLDKSFDSKPDNSNVGTLCKCIEESHSTEDSKNKGDVGKIDNASKNLIKTDEKGLNSDNSKDVNSSSTTNKSDMTNQKSKTDIDTNNATKLNPTGSLGSGSGSERTITQFSSDNQQGEEDVNLSNNDKETKNNNDTTAYYLLTSPPNVFTQFDFGSRNPFEQYLLNFPHVNMFRVDNTQNFKND